MKKALHGDERGALVVGFYSLREGWSSSFVKAYMACNITSLLPLGVFPGDILDILSFQCLLSFLLYSGVFQTPIFIMYLTCSVSL